MINDHLENQMISVLNYQCIYLYDLQTSVDLFAYLSMYSYSKVCIYIYIYASHTHIYIYVHYIIPVDNTLDMSSKDCDRKQV